MAGPLEWIQKPVEVTVAAVVTLVILSMVNEGEKKGVLIKSVDDLNDVVRLLRFC